MNKYQSALHSSSSGEYSALESGTEVGPDRTWGRASAMEGTSGTEGQKMGSTSTLILESGAEQDGQSE